jgi:hypothetical protein
MRKEIFILLFVLFFLPFVIAADLDVQKTIRQDVIIREIDNNASFKLIIKNLEGVSDDFKIYSLVGVAIYPKGLFRIDKDDYKELDVVIVPHRETMRDVEGFYIFDYEIKGEKTGYFKDKFSIKIISVKEAIDIRLEDIIPDVNEVRLKVSNKENISINEIGLQISSDFFDFAETFDLAPYENKTFYAKLDNLFSKGIIAGDYSIETEIKLNGQSSMKTSEFRYLEKGEVTSYSNTEGFFIRKTELKKINNGNIDVSTSINLRRNIITRLITTFSERPSSVAREGFFVDYSWEKEIGVGESAQVIVKANYSFPFILLLIVLGVIFGAKFMSRKDIFVEKRVFPVKTKRGEFALRVRIRIRTKKKVENINVSDKLPKATKLYTKTGTKPTKIDEQTGKLYWEIGNLHSGEERVITYIIYSKLNVVGSFELPIASLSYELNGVKEHSYSNKTSFISDTSE